MVRNERINKFSRQKYYFTSNHIFQLDLVAELNEHFQNFEIYVVPTYIVFVALQKWSKCVLQELRW